MSLLFAGLDSWPDVVLVVVSNPMNSEACFSFNVFETAGVDVVLCCVSEGGNFKAKPKDYDLKKK